MFTSKVLFAAFVAAARGVVFMPDDTLFATLLKRQDPGTPAYNCHDNCAIILSRQSNPCNSDAFKTDHNNCLQCAGPDNYNIWVYYGDNLSAIGSTCTFDTVPKSGKQPDVGPAVQSDSHSSASTTTPATLIPSPPSSTDSSLSASMSASPSLPPTTSLTGPISSPSSSTTAQSQSQNGSTASTVSAPPQQSTNIGLHHGPANSTGALVAIFIGARSVV